MPRNRSLHGGGRVTVKTLSGTKRRNRGYAARPNGRPSNELHARGVARYPRDPSLDPQLVWRGKDAQDAADLAVPSLPIYVQERIEPAAIIDALARRGAANDTGVELFSNDAGIARSTGPMIDFYRHGPDWLNRMVLGDSLLVMTSMAERDGLQGQVQTIYFDPPYGINFSSNWQVSTRKRDVRDGAPRDVTRQPEQIRAFRDTWRLGIHSYLAYLRDRLIVARELLAESGSIFVQIGDDNLHYVRCLLDEVFGAENFSVMIPFRKKAMTLGGRFLENMSDFLVWYFKDRSCAKYRQLYVPDDGTQTRWDQVELPDGTIRATTSAEKQSPSTLPKGARLFNPFPLNSPTFSADYVYPIKWKGKTYLPLKNQSWISRKERLLPLLELGRVFPYGGSLAYKQYLDDFPYRKLTSIWNDTRLTEKTYVVQTASRIVERCLLMTTDPGDLVLDPTCGSGTTAFVAEQWGRRWITCDTSRVALALARTRLMSARYPYYRLADDGRQQVRTRAAKGTNQEQLVSMSAAASGSGDARRGFVYKRVPRVTLKTIADNPEICEGMSARAIDGAIIRHAEMHTLYDQPFADKKRVRVSGPFTVESLSPHRPLDGGGRRGARETARAGWAGAWPDRPDFAAMILDHLRRAGVQNTVRSERLKFESLEPFPGCWVHGEGCFLETDGTLQRAAISIGPEYDTVGERMVEAAAAEAARGRFDLLIVCGFAFEAGVHEAATRHPKLTILLTRMNADLTLGDELLKQTGTGNLFMVFGEPDVELKRLDDGQLQVEIKGLDVYDPTTGELRSNSTDDIACWFIDVAYDGEVFKVSHAYFTGADQPFRKLQRALRAEVDEAAWASLYTTVSRPFSQPATGQIAIKVINHYGDEVMKAFDV